MEEQDDEQLVIAHYGAIKIQSIARMIIVRSRLLKQLNQRYEKIYDPKRDKYYYYDTQKDKSSWRKPVLLLKSDISKIAPPYVPEGEEDANADTRSAVDDEGASATNETAEESEAVGTGTDEDEHDDEGDDKNSTPDEEDDSESEYSSEDSEAVRDRRRLKRKHPRSKAQAKVDVGEDNLHDTTALDLSGLGARYITSRIYDMVELEYLNLSDNRLKRISPNIQYFSNLQQLDIHNNQLQTLPKELEELLDLTALDISHNNITTYPGRIYKLGKMQDLNLSHNPLKVIPVEIGNLELLAELGQWEIGIGFMSRLQRLHVAACMITEWPQHISSLQELLHLDLSDNALKQVPAEVAELVALKTLLLSRNSIETLAPEIYSMQNLEVLDLAHNQIKKLPDPPPSNLATDPPDRCMEKLVELNLSHNDLTVLDDLLGIFSKLERFDASHNDIQMFHGESLSKLTALSVLDLSHNSLELFPEGLKCCIHLKHIKVTHNKLGFVPEQLTRATKLQTIDFSHNEIVDAAGRIFAMLSDLRRLDLHHNQIGPLPAMMYTPKKLEHLDLSHNEIPTIAEGLGQLVSLTYLNLSYNQINSMPESISALTALRTLELKSNRLQSLPVTIGKLYRKLNRVTVSWNDFTASPALLTSLPLLLSCNLAWNPRLQGQFMDWQRVSAEYKPKKAFISQQILCRRIFQAVERLDGVIAAAPPIPPTSALYLAEGEAPAGEDDEDAELADLKGFIADDNPETAALSAAALKGAKKKRSKGIKKMKQVLTWQGALRKHLNEFAFRAKLSGDALKAAGNKASNEDKGVDQRASQQLAAQSMPTVADVKKRQHERLNSHMFSLFKALDKARGGTPIGMSWQDALQGSSVDLLEDPLCAPVLASLSVGAEYQDSIEALQYLINEIDALLILEELKLLLRNHSAVVSKLQVLASEEQAIVNLAPSIKMRLTALSMSAKQSVRIKSGEVNQGASLKAVMEEEEGAAEDPSEFASAENAQPVVQLASGEGGEQGAGSSNEDAVVAPSGDAEAVEQDTVGFDRSVKGAASQSTRSPSRKEVADSNLDVLARNIKLGVQARREQARLAAEAANLAKAIADAMDQVQKPSLLIDFAGLPHIAHSPLSVEGIFPGLNDDKEVLLSQLVDCCLHLGKALLLRCDALRDAAREVEVRGGIPISSLDISQRRGDDFLDLMEDVHQELSKTIEAKENESGGGAGGNRKSKSIFNKKNSTTSTQLLSTAIAAMTTEGDSDGEEGVGENKDGGSGEQSAPRSRAMTRASTGLSVASKPAAPAVVSLSTILPPANATKTLRSPIDTPTARRCLQLLLGHRALTLMWASYVAEVASGILKSRGVDPQYPRYRSHNQHVYSETPEWLVQSAGKLALFRGRVLQGLCIYHKAIEEVSVCTRFSKSAKSRTFFIAIMKLHLAQGNFMLARTVLFDCIRTLYAARFLAFDLGDDTAMPDPIDVLSVDKELALLQAYMETNIAQLRASGVFSSPYARFLSVQENGLLSAPSQVPLEVQRGLTPYAVEVLKRRKEAAADGSGKEQAQLEESREELKRTIADARLKAINALAVVQAL